MENKIMRTVFTVLTAIALAASLVMTPVPGVLMAASVNPTITTLSGTITAGQTQLVLASGTGVTAASGSVINTYLIIDDELIGVQTANPSTSTTVWRVTRGLKGTQATSHVTAANVLIVAPGAVFDNFTRGSCTASTQPYWPRIVISSGMRGTKAIYYEHCSDDNFIEAKPLGDVGLGGGLPVQLCTIPIGSVAYGSLGTSTTQVAGTTFYGSIFVPSTQKWTGLKVLQNGTVGTDKFIGQLWDADGNKLLNSATAGVTTSGANTFLSLAFTAAAIIPGPARYFVGVQGNGSTDGLRTVATATFIDGVASSDTGTFATLENITVPTTLTADKWPIMCLYQ